MNYLYKKFVHHRHYFIGILFLILLLLGLKSIFVNDYTNTQYTYKAYFTSVDGLNEKIPITLFGYNVGSVKKVWLDQDYTPVAILAINKNINIPDDSTITVKESSIMGDKVLQLNLGVNFNSLDPDSTIVYTNNGVSLLQLIDLLIVYINNIRQ